MLLGWHKTSKLVKTLVLALESKWQGFWFQAGFDVQLVLHRPLDDERNTHLSFKLPWVQMHSFPQRGKSCSPPLLLPPSDRARQSSSRFCSAGLVPPLAKEGSRPQIPSDGSVEYCCFILDCWGELVHICKTFFGNLVAVFLVAHWLCPTAAINCATPVMRLLRKHGLPQPLWMHMQGDKASWVPEMSHSQSPLPPA